MWLLATASKAAVARTVLEGLNMLVAVPAAVMH